APWQKHQSRAVAARRRQGQAEPDRLLAEELVWHLDEDAGAVAGVGFAAARAPVQQVDEDLQGLTDYRVRAPSINLNDKPDAAGVVLEVGVVEAEAHMIL